MCPQPILLGVWIHGSHHDLDREYPLEAGPGTWTIEGPDWDGQGGRDSQAEKTHTEDDALVRVKVFSGIMATPLLKV